MLKFENVTTEQIVAAVCDRCGREMKKHGLDSEWQEKISIAYRGGYDSIFGDGNAVEIDLCQHCVEEVLGQWLRVAKQASVAIDEAMSVVDASNKRIEAMEQKAGYERGSGEK